MWRLLLVESQDDYMAAIAAALRDHPELRLVAATDDGAQAARLIKVLRPDAVLINVSLCAHERFAVLENIVSHTPTRVLVYASGERAYDLALDRAPLFGANATSQVSPSTTARATLLLRAALDMCKGCVIPAPRSQQKTAIGALTAARTPAPAIERVAAPPNVIVPVRIVAIGASTGGPAAIELLLRRWGPDLALPVVVAQHMTTGFNSDLVSWLNTQGAMRVKLAENDETLEAGTMYFAPDGHHLSLHTENSLRLTPAAPDDATVPNVDRLFHSAARVIGPSALGILLTGMGEDGAAGLLNLRRIGARTLVQNQRSSLVFGMPHAAIKLGAAQMVLDLDEIAIYVVDCQQVVRRSRR